LTAFKAENQIPSPCKNALHFQNETRNWRHSREALPTRGIDLVPEKFARHGIPVESALRKIESIGQTRGRRLHRGRGQAGPRPHRGDGEEDAGCTPPATVVIDGIITSTVLTLLLLPLLYLMIEKER